MMVKIRHREEGVVGNRQTTAVKKSGESHVT